MNFTYDIGFLLPENIRLDTKIAFLCQFVGQLLAIMYCESILAAIFFFSMDIISVDLDSFRAAAVGVGV